MLSIIFCLKIFKLSNEFNGTFSSSQYHTNFLTIQKTTHLKEKFLYDFYFYLFF